MSRTIEIELPVCLECKHVGAIPNLQRNMRFHCTGPAAAPHKKRKMQHFTFRMVTDGVSWPD